MRPGTPDVPAEVTVAWVASYPRSGNTWMRFLLANYFLGPLESWRGQNRFVLTLNQNLEKAQAEGRSLEELFAELVRRSELDRRPVGSPRDVMLKTHWLCSDRHPFLERTRRAIYLLRNPRDVCLSALQYHRLFGRRGEYDDTDFARRFVEAGGDPHWEKLGFGTWEGHARSWLEERRFPVHPVRYEALRDDPAACLARVVEFLGAPLDPVRLHDAVEAATLEKLRQLEEKARQGGAFAGASPDHRFVHQGRTDQSLDSVAPGLDAAFDARMGEAAARLGYGR